MSDNRKMKYAERERTELPFQWPKKPLNIVLVEPEIPPNTGNISRLCAATGTILHLVEPLGFQLTEKQIRRAGLDYWDSVDIRRYADFPTYLAENPAGTKYFFSTAGTKIYSDVKYQAGDHLIFGNESRGLSDEIINAQPPENICCVPIILDHVRSLNLSNTASIALYEGLRQLNIKYKD